MTSDKYSHCYEHKKPECSRFLTGGRSRDRSFLWDRVEAIKERDEVYKLGYRGYAIQNCIKLQTSVASIKEDKRNGKREMAEQKI